MNAMNYVETWQSINQERKGLLDRRATLETELSEVNTQIAHLDGALEHLAPLAGVPSDSSSVSGLGITDAIRHILENSDNRLSAQDVRRELEERGFDFSGLTVPMASIYKVLSRLANDSANVEREEEGFRVYYRWKKPKGGEITDEDIPF